MSHKVTGKKKGTITPSKEPLASKSQQPWLTRGFDSIFDQFRRSFEDLMAPVWPLTSSPEMAIDEMPIRYPFVDMIDEGDHYIVRAELPGVTKDMIDVQVNKDALDIKAEMKKEREEKGRNYLHRESAYSAFQRSIAFPEEVNPSKVEGTMKEGILELKIPKKEPKPEEKMTKITLK